MLAAASSVFAPIQPNFIAGFKAFGNSLLAGFSIKHAWGTVMQAVGLVVHRHMVESSTFLSYIRNVESQHSSTFCLDLPTLQ